MKTPSAQSRNHWLRSLSPARRLRSKPRRNPRRLRRLLFEQFEDRRVLATAVDDFYSVPLGGTVEGNAWSNDSYSPWWQTGYWECVEEVQNGEYQDEFGEWHPLMECIMYNWVTTWQFFATGGVTTGPTANGYVTGETDGGAFSYTPNPGFVGFDSFGYSIHDNDDNHPHDSGTITIAVGVLPEPVGDSFATDEDTSFVFTAADLLGNDTDPTGLPLTASIGIPANGTISDNGNDTFLYVPNGNFIGEDSFIYSAINSWGATEAVVTITVSPVNDGPVAVNDEYEFDSSLAFSLDIEAPGVLANDYDVDFDGAVVSAVLVSQPAHGTVELSGDGSFVYTPIPTHVGSDSFTYRATDNHSAEGNLATVSINVIKTRDIEITSFTTDGTDLTVEYEVTGGTVADYFISLFTSLDGVSPEYALQSVAGNTAAGTHTLTIDAAFADLQEDYYLMAVVDGFDQIYETDENNNTLILVNGSFVAADPASGDNIRHVNTMETAEAITVSAPNANMLRLTLRDPSLWTEVPEGDPEGLYYDVTGDTKYYQGQVIERGTVSQLDIDVVTYNLVHTERPWQNPVNRWDVDNDGQVVAADLLEIINYMNQLGANLLDQPKGANDSFYDVNGDNAVSWNDYYHVESKKNFGPGTATSLWQNPDGPRDVNDDGVMDLEDATAIAAFLDDLFGVSTDYSMTGLDGLAIHSLGGDDRIISTLAASNFRLIFQGGDGNDMIQGTGGDDNILGGAGDDILFGGGGNDWMHGGEGRDELSGGAGDDWMDGANGDDGVSGGAGNDSLEGGDGKDTLSGNDGNDSLDGGGDNDNLDGGEGSDNLDGGDGADTATGGAGIDLVSGGSGNDALDGDEGNDTINGGDGDDSVEGGSGQDRLAGNDGSDTMDGDDGHDYLDGGDGHDFLNGGNGTDTIYSANGFDQLFSSGGNDSVNGTGGVSSCSEPPAGGWTIEDFCRPLVVFQGLTPGGGGYEGGSAIATLHRSGWALYEYGAYQGEIQVTLRITPGLPDDNTNAATPGVDYNSPQEIIVTIPENEPSVEFSIPLLADTPVEPTESFHAKIIDVEGLPFDGTGHVSDTYHFGIMDSTVEAFDDTLAPVTGPTLTFSPVGNDKSSGTLNPLIYSESPLKLRVEDFTPPDHGTVTRNPDPRFADYSLVYTPDPNYTGDVSFTYTATNGYQSDEATVYFTAGPSVSVADATAIVEDGEEGVPAVARFRVWLSESRPFTVSVDLDTVDLPAGDEEEPADRARARAGRDYTSKSVTLTFDPGQTEKWVEVPISADDIDEYSEPFGVELTSPSNVHLGQAAATALITDDDDEPELSIENATVEEPADETTEARLIVTLSHGTEKEATVNFVTEELPEPDPEEEDWLPATTDEDFTAADSTADVPTDSLTFEISIDILADDDSEPNEKFAVRLVSAENATLAEEESDAEVTISDAPAGGAIVNAVYGWEGGNLNLYLKAASGEFEITKYELDVDNDGNYDYATTAIEDDGSVLKFDLELLGMLGNPVEDGNYAAKVRVTTSDDATTEYPIQITVGNIWPDIQFDESAVLGAAGIPFFLPITTSDPGPDTITQIVVNWGDGTSDTILGSSGTPIHVYAVEGHYTIRATTTDEDGSTWAEHVIDIGEDNPPPIDNGDPEIISATAIILANGNAQLTVEADNSAGGSEDLNYEWDLDGDGIFESSGSNSIEIPPGDGPDLYEVQIRITDGAGRSTEGRYQFTAGGAQVVQFTVDQGKKLFRKLTPIPSTWHVHHTLQVGGEDLKILQQRFWNELGIDINKPQFLRGVPKSVHDQITGDQNAWIEKFRKANGLPSRAEAFRRIPLAEVQAFAARMEPTYSRFWVLPAATKSQIDTAANVARDEGFLLTRNKAARRVSLGILVTAGGVFALIASNTKVYANMASFDPDTHAEFNNFRAKYEDCLLQAMGSAGRPSKEAAYQLVDTLIDFGLAMGLDQGALAKAKTLMYAGLAREY